MLHLSGLIMLSAGGLGAASGLTTSWGIDSATGSTCSTLVKGSGPGSELDISMSGDFFGTSTVRRRCRWFLRYTLPSLVLTWYERTSTCLSWGH